MGTRRERVLLELEDHFTADMLRAAAATKLVRNELNNLSGTAVRTSRDNDSLQRSIKGVGDEVDRTSGKLRQGSNDIDRFSGRLSLILRTIAAIGPASVPIVGAAVPAVTALTAGLGAAAGALGVTLLAVQGLGDGLKALDAYQLEPTKKNLQALREEMDKIGPSGAEFVRFLDSLEPQLKSIQETARNGLFPGLEQSIETLLTELPMARRLVFDIADALGDVSADAARNLTGEGFEDFFEYLKTDAAPTLKAFAAATGNVVEGIANLLVAFAPLNRDFMGGMVAATEAFANWSDSLADSDGFQEFVDYIRQTGPKVAELIGQIALSLAAVAEAAAPVGGVVLPALTALLKVVEEIADSDLGTPLLAGAAAMSVLRLATLGWSKVAGTSAATVVAGNARAAASYLTVTTATERATMSAGKLAAVESARNRAALAGAGKLGAGLAGLAIAGTGAADGIGLTNTTSLALMGTMFGPWGTALGAAAGFTMDLTAANDGLEQAIRSADSAIKSMSLPQLNAALAELDAQLTSTNEKFSNFDPFSTNLSDPIETAKNNIQGFIAGLNEVITGSEDAAEAKREDTAAAIESAEANARYARQARIAGVNAGYSASEIRGMTAAMEEQRNEALQAFDAVTQYGQALADARKHAKDAKGGIDASTKAGRENRDVLSNLAGAWNNQSKAVTNNIAKWKEARSNFIATATAMGVPIQKARDLANRLMEIPKQRVIDIEMRGGDESIAAMKRIKAQAEDVAGQYRISFIVTQTNAFNKRNAMDAAGTGSADGSTVPKTGLPYADRHPYLLADGEEVISNRFGQADRHRALLKAINANRLADGGTVGIPGLMFGGTATGRGIGTAASLVSLDYILRGLAELNERELKLRQRQLDKLTRVSEREYEAAKKRLDEERAALKDLRDARRDFMREVASNFRSDVFGGTDLAQAFSEGWLGSEFGNQLAEFARQQMQQDMADAAKNGQTYEPQAYNPQDYIQEFIATLTPQQMAYYQAQATTGQLGQDANDADAFRRVLDQLRDMGLTGGAYTQLATSGNLALAQQYAQMGPGFIETLMQDFKDRNQSLKNLGRAVGNDRFGADIREQLVETRKAVRIAERQESELREIKQINRQMERRLERLERLEEKAPEKTTKALTNAVGHGQRSSL